MLCCRMTSAVSSSASHSWRVLCGGMVCSFLCCWLRIVLVDDENRCEIFLPKQLTLISVGNELFRHNLVMIYTGKTGRNTE